MLVEELHFLLQRNQHIKLNLGSGGEEIPGYLSVDKFDLRATVNADVVSMDLPENTVEEILTSHLFEHISPYKATDTLAKWCRWLQPGGKLIMELPNIEALCERFAAANKDIRYGILNCIYGAVNTTGGSEDITAPHLWGWYPGEGGILWDHLKWAGFGEITFGPEQIPHPMINFRVEARKPETRVVK
jgi:hypothetical protein